MKDVPEAFVVYSVIYGHVCQTYRFYDREGEKLTIQTINAREHSFSYYGLFSKPESIQRAWQEALEGMEFDDEVELLSTRDVFDQRGPKIDTILIDYWLHRQATSEEYLRDTYMPGVFEWAREALTDPRRFSGSWNSFSSTAKADLDQLVTDMLTKLEESISHFP